jgi:hypothetical protein
MTDKNKNKDSDKGSVRIPEWVREELRDVQYEERKATGVEPTFGELLARAWTAFRSPRRDLFKNLEDFLANGDPAMRKNLLKDMETAVAIHQASKAKAAKAPATTPISKAK